jgi:hypothetical protein
MREWRYIFTTLDLGLNEQRSASRLVCFNVGEEGPGTHCIGGWVYSSVGLNAVEKGRIFLPLSGFEPLSSNQQSELSRL